MKVEEVMLPLSQFPVVEKKTILKEALTEMGEANLGLVCIINDKQELLGLITDGDLRRKLLKLRIHLEHSVLTKFIRLFKRFWNPSG